MAVLMAMLVSCSIPTFGSDGNILTTVRWIAMKFDTHAAQRVIPNDFGYLETFSLAPPACQDLS